jgi:hypothetical protein
LFALTRSSPKPALMLSWCGNASVRPEMASIFYKQQTSLWSNNICARATSRNFSKSTADKASKETVSSTKVVAAAEQYNSTSSFTKFLNWYLAEKTMPPRWTLPWYREMVLICSVFAVTGSSTMILVRFVDGRMPSTQRRSCEVSFLFSLLRLDLLTGSPRSVQLLGLEGKS